MPRKKKTNMPTVVSAKPCPRCGCVPPDRPILPKREPTQSLQEQTIVQASWLVDLIRYETTTGATPDDLANLSLALFESQKLVHELEPTESQIVNSPVFLKMLGQFMVESIGEHARPKIELALARFSTRVASLEPPTPKAPRAKKPSN
jgi:hypothetical protein